MLGVFRAWCLLELFLALSLNFTSFLLFSLYYKVACLVAQSFLQPLVCLLLFQVASVSGSEFVKESVLFHEVS